jgi:hypothetical protein
LLNKLVYNIILKGDVTCNNSDTCIHNHNAIDNNNNESECNDNKDIDMTIITESYHLMNLNGLLVWTAIVRISANWSGKRFVLDQTTTFRGKKHTIKEWRKGDIK